MIRILGKIENNILPAIETDRLYLRQRLVADIGRVSMMQIGRAHV